jgi:hypothetical protein
MIVRVSLATSKLAISPIEFLVSFREQKLGIMLCNKPGSILSIVPVFGVNLGIENTIVTRMVMMYP